MYANIATKIPAAVATNASLITGAITEKLTLLAVENFANDSNIPTTVPNKPIKGAVDDTIDNHEIPVLASLTKEISHTFKNSLETGVLFKNCPILDNGFIRDPRDNKEFRLLISVEIYPVNRKYL